MRAILYPFIIMINLILAHTKYKNNKFTQKTPLFSTYENYILNVILENNYYNFYIYTKQGRLVYNIKNTFSKNLKLLWAWDNNENLIIYNKTEEKFYKIKI